MAFTLIEISIVLVVIGLIVGSVLVGQNLIKAAKLRKAVTTIEQFETASMTFRLKYNGMPGDINNATSILDTTASNGNGNGVIDRTGFALNTGLLSCAISETIFANQHLAMAGLINLNPFVIANTAPSIETNCQADVGWIDVLGRHALDPTWGYYAGTGLFIVNTLEGTYLTIGGDQYVQVAPKTGYSIVNTTTGSVMTPYEAYWIDSKIDDGKPRTGALWNQVVLTGGLKNDWSAAFGGVGSGGCHTQIGSEYVYRTTVDYLELWSSYCGLIKKSVY